MNIEEQLKQILKIPVIEERYLELIKLLNKDRDRLMKQNKRYKQALENIAISPIPLEIDDAVNIARQALEGEK